MNSMSVGLRQRVASPVPCDAMSRADVIGDAGAGDETETTSDASSEYDGHITAFAECRDKAKVSLMFSSSLP